MQYSGHCSGECNLETLKYIWISKIPETQLVHVVERLRQRKEAKQRTRLCFYQTRSAWSVDQGSNKNHSPAYNFAPTVTKFCVIWEGLSLPHGTKFGNCRCKIVDSRAFPSWSLIHGLRWSGLIKAEPGYNYNGVELIPPEYPGLRTGITGFSIVNNIILPW